uniref:NB-ARC domain-containing protein n=1 Tax=Grammatophora oceanica TaxID=210454 RepID=A0A7S1UWN8_9STRA|mmetsp:Transcript_27407/g.40189  ORF Transcript_27407/g.40189 Transcript_27407/m.40189 type:complete len:2059 (+) Transcript_27407:189-6365(+)
MPDQTERYKQYDYNSARRIGDDDSSSSGSSSSSSSYTEDGSSSSRSSHTSRSSRSSRSSYESGSGTESGSESESGSYTGSSGSDEEGSSYSSRGSDGSSYTSGSSEETGASYSSRSRSSGSEEGEESTYQPPLRPPEPDRGASDYGFNRGAATKVSPEESPETRSQYDNSVGGPEEKSDHGAPEGSDSETGSSSEEESRGDSSSRSRSSDEESGSMSGSEETGSEWSGSEETGSEGTGSEGTGSDETGSYKSGSDVSGSRASRSSYSESRGSRSSYTSGSGSHSGSSHSKSSASGSSGSGSRSSYSSGSESEPDLSESSYSTEEEDDQYDEGRELSRSKWSSSREEQRNPQQQPPVTTGSSSSGGRVDTPDEEDNGEGALGRVLGGVPLRRAQSPTTTISSLSASQITGAISQRQRSSKNRQRSQALEELEANVQSTLAGMNEEDNRKTVRELVAQDADDEVEKSVSTSSNPHMSHHLLHGFEALLGALLQLSDELELISTFGGGQQGDGQNTVVSSDALNAVLSHSPTLDSVFSALKPILQHYLEEEPDDEMDHLLSRAQKLVRLLCELTYRVCQRQEWNSRAETAYVTLLELLERNTLEITCVYEEQSIPEYQLSGNLRRAWAATGHVEELKTLYVTNDTWLFRQVCYEVLVSTDHWCPNVRDLGIVCDVAASTGSDPDGGPQNAPSPDGRLAPTPPAALHVLDKVNGDPLPLSATMASILRRILPPHAMTDASILDSFSSIRSTIRNPLGLSGTVNTVAISSVPEVLNDPSCLGMAGVGKTTMAAMVASHPDVRRFFKDGVAWVSIGKQELDYARYTQCLRELVSQLTFYDSVPLFAELLHCPGEPISKRHRREEGFMIYARDTVTELLQMRNVLIILDDVYFEQDLEWFQFVPTSPQPARRHKKKQEAYTSSVLVSTRVRDLLPAADTVEIDLLDEQEAIKLLVTESGQSSDHVMAESKEARAVVRECANHPLAVKSVGRWLSLKHATAGVISSVEEIHEEVAKSIDRILENRDSEADMMYEIMSMSFSPAVNGQPTNVIKFCFAAFVQVFCNEEYLSEAHVSTSSPPMIPWRSAELLFETLLEMEEETLFDEGSLFYSQRKEATILIPEALSALGVLKLITTFEVDDESNDGDSSRASLGEERYLQIMHIIQHEYGEYLSHEEEGLKKLTRDAERRWNGAFVTSFMNQAQDWDSELPDASRDYALELLVSHMLRAEMFEEAAKLLADESFVRGRMFTLGRETATRRHIKDCEKLYSLVKVKLEKRKRVTVDPRQTMVKAYEALGGMMSTETAASDIDQGRMLSIEAGRAHYEIGFSLAEKRCWSAAIAHWESSQELLLSSLGMVEFVAAILFNVGVVYAEMNEYEQALASLKQCLRIRGAIHGEEHILYAQTIQKIGDVFLGMSDYTEAMESYNWAMDVMHIEPNHHRVDIGDILDNMGNIHYSKGEVPDALRNYQDALRSKKVELGDDHPELAVTYQHIGNCLSDQGDTEEAIAHFEEAIRLKELDPTGGPERDADVLSIEGVLNNLTGRQEEGLRCYEKSLEILVNKVPHRKEKIAALLHLIGCVHLMNGEHKKAMKLFEESLQARRKVLGFVHLDVASTLFNMAFLHQTRNRLDKALMCLEEALKIRQLRLPDSEKVALTHEKIGTLAKAIGKSKKAEMSFEEALRIRRLIHGDEHEAVATVLHEMGDLMDDLGEYEEAMNNYVDALNIRRKRLGNHEDVAATLYSMGFTLHNQDSSERALQCFEEALSIRRARLGEEAKEVGDTLNMMGFLQAKRGELDSALTLLWDALRIRKTHKDDVKVSETLKNIGNVHREKQEHDLAVECYEECLRIRRSELGDDHEKVADALIAIGNVRSDLEQIEQAMEAYNEALKIRTLVHGENDERVAAVLQYMGTMEFRSGDLDRARAYLKDFVRIRHENHAEHDGDYVNVLFMIGNIHKIQGDDLNAKKCWSEAYEVFQELGLAQENPQIARVMDSLLQGEAPRPKAPQPPTPPPAPARPAGAALVRQPSYGTIGSGRSSRSGGILGKITSRFKDTLRDEKMPKYQAAP